MATTTEKGFPYPEAPDPDKPRTDIEKLAQKIDEMPGIATMTAEEILDSTDLWVGRVVAESGTGTLFVNIDGTASGWTQVHDKRFPIPIIYGGTGLKVAPSMLVNLGSGSPDSPLKSLPRPGVTGVLPIALGGTAATNRASARYELDVPSATDVGYTETNFVAIFESAMNA